MHKHGRVAVLKAPTDALSNVGVAELAHWRPMLSASQCEAAITLAKHEGTRLTEIVARFQVQAYMAGVVERLDAHGSAMQP